MNTSALIETPLSKITSDGTRGAARALGIHATLRPRMQKLGIEVRRRS